MATVNKRTNKDGSTAYTIRVYRGRSSDGHQLKPYTTTWKPTPGMTPAKERKELAKIMAAFEENCRNGMICTERKTFEEYARYVIALKEQGGLKHRTAVRYAELLERINDVDVRGFGYMKLSDIRADHLNAFYAALSEDGVNLHTGGGLSPKTILEHHHFASTVFTQALREGLILFNPADRAVKPKIPRKEAEAFDPAELGKIMEAVKGDSLQWQAITLLLIGTGARRGEICGLRWFDIDFARGQLHICNNLLYAPDVGVYADTTKTDESRYVSVSPTVLELLRRHRAEQVKTMRDLGSKCEYTGYVFTQWNGKPIHPDSITDYYGKLSDKLGLHINPHKFRHTQASILINEGIDIVTVSKRLGHAKVSTTTDIYAHVMRKADEEAAKTVSQVIFKCV